MTGNDPRPGGSPLPIESSTVSSLRERNRSAVLRQMVLAGSTSRAELARDCGLSVASVTNIATELIAEGLVHESGSLASRGGRPVTVLKPRPDGAYFIGADVGERGVAVELFDLAMKRVDREFRGGQDQEAPDAIARDLDEALDALRERNPRAWSRVRGVGLALPGIVEIDEFGSQVLYAESLGWPPTPVSSLISHDLVIHAENGAKTLAKAEQWFGAARGVDHAVVVLLGRGVGLGVISNGKVLRGARSSAGEWGHTRIERGGRPCRCGRRGCVESYLGAGGILDSWRERGGVVEGSGWRALSDLLEAADRGEHVPAAVVDDLVEMVGASLGGLVNLFNPERVVLGGWVGLRIMDSLAPRLEAAMRDFALARPGQQFSLVPCTFGGDTVALGAAIMPLEVLVSEPLTRS